MKEFVLKLAREAIETYVKTEKKIPIPKDYPEELKKKRGVFVTIYKKPRELRGCIGLPYPQQPLIQGLIEAAVETCEDPRFPPLSKEELKDIFIEVSVLTEPKLIKVKSPKEYFKQIEIGKHGLILMSGSCGGLFLPQVPVEQRWNCEQYLENLCYKAGLTSDIWLDPLTRIYKFETEIFSEK
jgi:uncharacterized protein (TIGR00296 family)